MNTRIVVPRLTALAKVADVLMIPLMYALSGTFREYPQQTHIWNNLKLAKCRTTHLDRRLMVHCRADSDAKERLWGFLPRFHIPLLGGWKKYVVLRVSSDVSRWNVGWQAIDAIGVSQIQINGYVRLLLGQYDVCFFALNENGEQIELFEVARGEIGDNGPYRKVLLL